MNKREKIIVEFAIALARKCNLSVEETAELILKSLRPSDYMWKMNNGKNLI